MPYARINVRLFMFVIAPPSISLMMQSTIYAPPVPLVVEAIPSAAANGKANANGVGAHEMTTASISSVGLHGGSAALQAELFVSREEIVYRAQTRASWLPMKRNYIHHCLSYHHISVGATCHWVCTRTRPRR